MATDNTTNQTETANASTALQEGDVEHAQVTQSGNAATPIQVPQGQNVVRVQVTPGETVELPFPTDGLVARLGDNGNLAIKVGDVTVILLGYAEATGQGEITILGSDNRPVDVAAVLASTDPNLDIQTAAGPAAGDQGTGADNNGGLFAPFDPSAGIGGLNAIGGLQATNLNYGLVEREFPELIEEDAAPDTVPIIINIRQGAVINEDDLQGGREQLALKEQPYKDFDYQNQINGELTAKLGIAYSFVSGAEEDGNDQYDTDDHEEGSQNPANPDPDHDDNGSGLDEDREPLTSTATVTVDFNVDVPGKITFQNGADIPLQTQLEGMNLTSHGNVLQYALLPAVADDPMTPGDQSHGEVLVAYYTQPTYVYNPETEQYEEGTAAVIVFTIGVREQLGADSVSDFNIDFTIYGPVDNIPGASDNVNDIDLSGDITKVLDIGVPFFAVDSDGSVTPSPAGDLVFHDVDDVPHFLGSDHYQFHAESGGSGDGYYTLELQAGDATIIHDETNGVQHGGSAEGGDGDRLPSTEAEDDITLQDQYVYQALDTAGWDSESALGAAQTRLNVSFGADGRAGDWQEGDEGNWQFVGNKEAGKTVFTGDGATDATAFQIYVGSAAAPVSEGATNWTVMIDGVAVTVRGIQIDANTIIGVANKGDVNGDGVPDDNDNKDGNNEGGSILGIAVDEPQDVPVFVLQVDPSTGTVTLVQLHQINHSNTDSHDETSPSLTIDGQPVVYRATDYDGDHVDGPLTVQVQDDGPTVTVTPPQETNQALAVDETRRDGGDGVPSATVNFSGNFGNGSVDYGTDGAHQGPNGADGIGYSLTLNGTGVASGLYAIDPTDTTDSVNDGYGQGAQILLYNINGEIHGRTSADGDDYFTITIDGAGNVTLSQQQNLWHPDAGTGSFAHDDVQVLNLAAGTLNVVQTVTDADGDHAEGAFDISKGFFRFEDDGPVAAVNGEIDVPSLTLDESPVSPNGDGVKSVSADFGANFNSGALDYGTDGPGKVAYTLDLSAAGISSGLYALDASDVEDVNDGIGQGDPILLYNIDGVIHGRTSADGDDYFTISVDGDGKVTFAQQQNIWHGDTGSDDDTQYLVTDEASDLKITQTITDADEDTSSVSIDLGDDIFSIQDDGPNAVVNGDVPLPTLTLDESPIPADGDGVGAQTVSFAANFVDGALDYGTDGPGSASYVLSLSSNGVGTNLYALDPNAPGGKGAEIVLNDIGGQILGQVGNTTYFSISVDSDGKVTFGQWLNIWHGDASSNDDSETLNTDFASALKLTQTLTDADGDTSSASLNLGQGVFKIEDDGPSIADGGTTVYMDETPGTQESEVAAANVPSGIATLFGGFGAPIGVGKTTGGLDYSFGTDGPGSVHITDSAGNDLNNAASGLYRVSDGAEIKFFTDASDPTLVLGKVGNDVVLAVHLDTATNTLWVAQYAPIQHPDSGDSNDYVTTGGRMHLTVIDADGDKVTDGPSLVVVIRDDGPTITDGGSTVTLDESAGNQGGTHDTSDVSLTLSALAATLGATAIQTAHTNAGVVAFSYGADGAGSVMLGNAAGAAFNGTPSGFTRTSDGAPILLYTDASNPTILKGMVGNELVLAIHLDTSNNSIWVATYQAVKHTDTTDSNDMASGAIGNIHITVTDRDGDHVTNPASITVQILDDGPTVTLTTHGNISITLDESVGADATDPATSPTADEPAESGFFGTKTGSAAGLFNAVDFGTDGAGAGVNPEYKLVLRDTDGSGTAIGTTEVATNLVATDPAGLYANDNIILVSVSDYQVNGYVGHYDGVEATDILAFVVRIDKVTGEITVSQALPIAHDVDGSSAAAHDDTATLTAGSLGGIFVSLTATDGDGDKATAVTVSPLGISFEDDGPKAIGWSYDTNTRDNDFNPATTNDIYAMVDEDALPGGANDAVSGDDQAGTKASGKILADFGQDGPAAGGGFSLNIDPNMLAALKTPTGLSLHIDAANSDGGQLIVRDSNDVIVFTLTLGADAQNPGAWEFELKQPLKHSQADTEDNIFLNFGVTLTDGDGDTTASEIRIMVDDDMPAPVADVGGSYVETTKNDLGTVEDFLLANDKVGADGLASVTILYNGDSDGNKGGKLEISGGHVWYTAPNVQDNTNEVFWYRVTDKDGDTRDTSVTVTVTDRGGGTGSVTLWQTLDGGYEDNQSSPFGQTAADPVDGRLTLPFKLQITPTDAGDTTDSVVIGGIPSGASVTFGALALPVSGGSITLVRGQDGGIYDSFLNSLTTTGAVIDIKLQEHDSRDLTITLNGVVDNVAITPGSDGAVVDAVAAQPLLADPADETKQETGAASTTFTVNTTATFADFGDGNEAQYILIKNPDAGWSLGAVTIDGVPATAVVGGLAGYPGYTAFAVSAQADAADGSQGQVGISFIVIGPGNVAADTTKTIEIKAVAIDTEEGAGLDPSNDVATATQYVDLKITDRTGGTDDVSFTGGGEGGYEDGQATSAGQTAVDPGNGQLSLAFNLKATATDPGDTVSQVIIGGIPSGATATWTDGVHTLTITGGATVTITGATGGSENIAGTRAAFLADLIDGNGANLVVKLEEHDSRDVTLTMQSTIGGTQTAGDTTFAIVDAVAAQPALVNPDDQTKQELGSGATVFAVTTTATFADFGDGNEAQYVLVKNPDAGWSLGTVTIDGSPAIPVPGGLAGYPGYTAFAVSTQADAADGTPGQVVVSILVNGPANVDVDTTKTIEIKAVAVDTEVGLGLDLNNNVAEATQTVDLKITDRSGGTNVVDFLGDSEGGYEDDKSTAAGQSTADDANQLLTLNFNLKATATDPGDVVNQVTLGGFPSGALATWTQGGFTLTFAVGSNVITPVSGGTENVPGARAAFLADLIDGNGANIQITLAEHDSRDVVLTMQSVIGGTATANAQDTAIVDAVAAQPIFLVTPNAQSLVESGGATTNFTVSTSAFFHDLADANETQYILVAAPFGAAWGIDSVSINGSVLTPTLSGPQFLGYITYEVTGQADALNGTVPVVIQVHGPGNVDATTTQALQIIAGAQDQIEGVDRETGNNFAQAYQSVNLTITDRTGGTDSVTLKTDPALGYEDANPTSAGQTSADPLNTQLTLVFTMKVTPTDPTDPVDQAVIGGIPTGAVATWTQGGFTLTFAAGSNIITAVSGGTENIPGARAAFLAALESAGGADIAVKLAEHDSRDVTLTLNSTVGGTLSGGDHTETAIVDAVAAQPALADPADQATTETGGASTSFLVQTTVTFADIADGDEVQYVLIKNPDGGWAFNTVLIDGAPAGAGSDGALIGYPGYTAFAVTTQADAADATPGQVALTFTVTGPGNVAADTTKTIEIKAVAIDTEAGAGLNAANNVAEITQTVDLKIVDRVGGSSDVSFTGGGEGGYEDNQPTPAGQTAADPANGLLSLPFNLKATATDPGDTVSQVTIGGIPTGATATWNQGGFSLTFGPGSTTVTATLGGTGTDASRAAFLADLIDGNGANLFVTVEEHDSRDVTLTMQSVIGGQATNIDTAFAVVDAVAAQPALIDPANDSKQESGAVATTFTVTTTATFADFDDANEAQYILIKNPDAGWSLGTVIIDGVTATAIPGGLTGYAGYTAFAVSTQADVNDASKGSVNLVVEVNGPGDVAATTTKTIEIKAVAIDTEVGSGLGTGNDKAEATQLVDLTITDRTGGTDSVTLKTDPALGYEDANPTSAGQTSADPLNTQLTLVFTMKVTPTDPTDPVDQAVIGGIPTGAVATWTQGGFTLTFAAGSNIITAVSGGTENIPGARAAFLAALESAGGADIAVKLAEHDSRDVTLTLNSTVGGTLSGGDHTETAIVDAVAAQPSLDDSGDQSQAESGSSRTIFSFQTTASFADFADADENQYILIKNFGPGWSLDNLLVNLTEVWASAIDGATLGYPGYSAYLVNGFVDAGAGSINVIVAVGGPGNVPPGGSQQLVEIKSVAIDVVDGNDLTTGNNVAEATQTVNFTVTDTAPTVAAVQTMIRVDEDGFAAGNKGAADDAIGDDTSTDAVTFSGNFSYSTGKDAITSITLGTTGGLTGLVTLDNLPVKTVWDAGTKTLTGFADADNDGVMDNGERPVFTLVVTSIANGAYTFTLNEPIRHDAANGGAGANYEDDKSFNINIQVTDADGSVSNVAQATINIDDDTPVAVSDAEGAVNSGATKTGTVLSGAGDDSFGADGAKVGGGVVGAVVGINNTPQTTGVATVLHGTFGDLTLQANGTYTYIAKPNAQIGAGGTDTFSYTIEDGDGDRTTAQVTFNVTPVTLTVTPGDATVDEAALDTKTDAGDLGHGSVTGSQPNLATETVTGNLTLALGVSVTPQTNVVTPLGIFSIDANGHYTYTLTSNSLAHTSDLPNTNPNATNPDAVVDTFTISVSDTNGNTGSTSITIHVKDDVPSVVVGGSGPALTVDETDFVTDATANFAGIFTETAGADGKAGLTNYALGVSAPGVNSGLVDTATGNPVFLFVISGQVVGKAGPDAALALSSGPTVFTVSVNAAGDVTLNQLRAIAHDVDGGPGAAHDDPKSMVAGLVTLTATITDGDGDTGSATANIGDKLVFKDDGPTLAASGAIPALTVDESVLGTDDTKSFASVFVPTYGADGAGTVDSFVLGVKSDGVNSGLIDVASNQAIVLKLNGNVVEGHVGTTAGALAFTLSVNAAGDVKLDQILAVKHSNTSNPDDTANLSAADLITLTAKVTDKDGDTNTATANIGLALNFKDDGPTLAASGAIPALTVDESVLGTDDTKSFASVFVPTYGADGAGTVDSFVLGVKSDGVNSGLIDVASNQAIVLKLNGNVVEGHVGTTAGALAFTLSVNAAGDVKLDQILAVKHSNTSNPDDTANLSAADLITLTAKVTDKDGDTNTATANIGLALNFKDDGPTLAASGAIPTLIVDETVLGTDDTKSFASVFVPTYGADGAGTVGNYVLGIKSDGVASGLVDVASNSSIVLKLNGNVVEGHVGTTAGALAFTLTVNAAGDVKLDQILAVKHPNAADADDAVTLSATDLITLTATVTDKDGDTNTATALIGKSLSFEDDGPSAVADTGSVNEGALLTVTAAGGVLANDQSGADGYQATGGVVGVRAAGGDTTSSVITGVATSITGLHGTLILQADGSYTYQSTANNITSNTTDVFVYTIKDRDGDLSTTTLTINLADSGLLAPNDNDITVYEKGLDLSKDGADLAAGTVVGSLGLASSLETDNTANQLNATGGFGTLTYALQSGGNAVTAGTYGSIQVNANGTYVYTLTKPYDTSPDNNNGANVEAGKESFTYVVTDANGNTKTGVITVDIVDDTPTANNDGTQTIATLNGDATPEISFTAASGLLANDIQGADGAAITKVTFNGTDYLPSGGVITIAVANGTLIVNPNGAWTFNQTAFAASPTTHNFTYTLTDGDGDTSTATFGVALVVSTNPTFSVTDAKVDEDGLISAAGGAGDDNQDSGDSGAGLVDPAGVRGTEAIWQSQISGINWGGPAGTFTLAAGSVDANGYMKDSTGALLKTLAGDEIKGVLSDTGHTLTGYADADVNANGTLKAGATPLFTVNVTDAGVVTVNLLQPIQHPGHDDPNTAGTQTSYEDNLNIPITVTATNGNGQSTQHNFNVNVDDDTPVANDNSIATDAGSAGTADVVFIVDVSGSMTDAGGAVANVPDFADNRLGLARYSMRELLNSHPEILNVKFTKFDDDAQSSVWMSRADALLYINNDANFTGGSTTNYDAALTSMMDTYNTSVRPAGTSDQTLVYFMSDGVPNPSAAGIDNDGSGTNVSIAEWEAFLNTPANDITNVFGIGLGSGVNTGNLNPIAYPNTDTDSNGVQDRVVVLADSNLLALTTTLDNLLTGVVNSASGNLITDPTADSSGADGWGNAKLVSVAYDTDGSGAGNTFTTLTFTSLIHQFTINLGTGRGTLVVNDDGSYTYTAPTGAADANPFFVQYTVQDADGDLSTGKLNIDINVAPVLGGGDQQSFSIAENTTAITTITSTDADAGATKTYSIVGGADAALFTINASTGVLAFANAPNFEAPADTGANNVYDVKVQVSDGSLTDVQAITVTVTNVNEAPVITSPNGGNAFATTINENTTAVTTVVASDVDAGTTLTYSLSGADASKFTVNASGVVSFISAPNFEAPTDVGGDNIYNVTVTVSDGTLTDTQALTITVANVVNENAPTITSNGGGASANISVAENATAVTTVVATDLDGQAITYSISGGADALKFAINPTTGVLTFVAAPNFEAPTDAGGDNVYNVTVTASDGTLVDTQAIAVTVTNVNEADPVITSNGGGNSAAISVAENTKAVTTVVATDADAGTTITYSISGGADAGKFAINSSTGALTFVNAPDFENPTDAGANNVYDVIVTASDGTKSDTQTIAVTVTDVFENTAPVAGDDHIFTNQLGAFTVLDEWLLANDSDTQTPNGLTITGVSSGGNSNYFDALSHAGTAVTVNFDESGGTSLADGDTTSFTYTVSDPSAATDTGTVEVTRDDGNVAGGAGNDILIGSSGAETLTGNGGNDILVGGGGDDTYIGGVGTDTVVLRSSVTTIDTNFNDAHFENIEVIDLGVGHDNVQLGNSGNSGANRLNADDVFNVTDDKSVSLFIKGDASDSVFIENTDANKLTISGTQDQAGFTHYTGTSGGNTVHLYVDSDIVVNSGTN